MKRSLFKNIFLFVKKKVKITFYPFNILAIIFYFASFTYSLSAIAEQNTKSVSQGNDEKFFHLINELKSISTKEFLQKIGPIKKRINKYIFYRARYCNGEFSSVVFLEEELFQIEHLENIKKKLSNEEMIYCLNKLFKDQLRYSSELLKVQKKYLIYLNKMEMKQLLNQNNQLINQLKKDFKEQKERILNSNKRKKWVRKYRKSLN